MRATRIWPALVLVILGATDSANSMAADAITPDSDLGRLQGRWTARAGAKRLVRVELSIEGKQARVLINTPQGIRFKVRGEIQVDESTSPRKLDWIKFTGADQQEFPTVPAIYRISQDSFVVCNGGLNGGRPTAFKSGDGMLADVIEFQRETPRGGGAISRTDDAADKTRK